MNNEVKIEGLDKLEANVKKINDSVDKEQTGKILIKQAEIIRDRIRDKAPQGPTGNLKRSPVAKLMPENASYPAIAIAGIDRKIAPHAHLVEFGTSRAPAHPFFRPAVDECQRQVMNNIKNELKDKIEGAV